MLVSIQSQLINTVLSHKLILKKRQSLVFYFGFGRVMGSTYFFWPHCNCCVRDELHMSESRWSPEHIERAPTDAVRRHSLQSSGGLLCQRKLHMTNRQPEQQPQDRCLCASHPDPVTRRAAAFSTDCIRLRRLSTMPQYSTMQ